MRAPQSPSATSPKRVFIAIADPALRHRAVSAVFAAADEVLTADSLIAVAKRSRHDGERCVVVVGSEMVDSPLTAMALSELRRAEPLLQVVLCLAMRDPLTHRLAGWAAAGLDHFLILGPDRDADLGREVALRLKHVLPQRIVSALPGCSDELAHRMETWGLRNAYRPMTVERIADYFRVGRDTVTRHIRAGLRIEARELVTWVRLVHVAVLLDMTDLTVTQIAKSLAFDYPAKVHGLVHRAMAITPLRLRDSGAVAAVLRLRTP